MIEAPGMLYFWKKEEAKKNLKRIKFALKRYLYCSILNYQVDLLKNITTQSLYLRPISYPFYYVTYLHFFRHKEHHSCIWSYRTHRIGWLNTGGDRLLSCLRKQGDPPDDNAAQKSPWQKRGAVGVPAWVQLIPSFYINCLFITGTCIALCIGVL